MTISEKMLLSAKEDMYEKFGIRILSAENGAAQSELELKPNHWNTYHMPYGGVQFNIADLTSGIAFLSAGGYGVTVSGNVHFLRAPSADIRKLFCRAHVTKRGRRMYFVEAEVTDEAETVLASYSFIFSNS